MSSIKNGTKWGLQGYDTFEEESYHLDGTYDDEASAKIAGFDRLKYLEESQPTSTSGGQKGIQDRVYIVRPDGTNYRLLR